MFNSKRCLAVLLSLLIFSAPANSFATTSTVKEKQLLGFMQPTEPVVLTALQSSAIRKQSSGYNIESSIGVDLNNDGLDEIVSLLAKPYDKTSLYRSNFRIAIIDSKNSRLSSFGLPKDVDGGYTGNLSFVDLTDDGTPEIALVSSTGGSGGMINLVVFKKETTGQRIIFNSSVYSKLTTLNGAFKDGYEAEISMSNLNGSTELKRNFDVDVKSRKALYQKMKLYASGKVIKDEYGKPNASPWGGLLTAASIADPDKDGKPELVYRTVAKGTNNTDSLGEVEVGFKWSGQSFIAIHTAFIPYYDQDTNLMTDAIENVEKIIIKKNNLSASPAPSAISIQELLKSLSGTKIRLVRLPKELERQSSNPLYTVEISYKDGTSDIIQTTETGKFAYRVLDVYGSWIGGVNDKLLQQLDTAFKSK